MFFAAHRSDGWARLRQPECVIFLTGKSGRRRLTLDDQGFATPLCLRRPASLLQLSAAYAGSRSRPQVWIPGKAAPQKMARVLSRRVAVSPGIWVGAAVRGLAVPVLVDTALLTCHASHVALNQ